MTSWQVVAAANTAIAVAYFGIFVAILTPLVQTHQLRSNRLGVATAAIFLSCALHHGSHSVHLLVPDAVGTMHGMTMRDLFGWDMAAGDLFGALVALYYWSLRRTYGPLMQGAKLFEDLRERQRQAMELNDDVVQGLAVAQLALAMNEPQRSREAIEDALASSRRIISELLGDDDAGSRLGPGDLVRRRPASIGGSQ